MTVAEKVAKTLSSIPNVNLIDIFWTMNSKDPYTRTPEEMRVFSWTMDELESRGLITWDDDDMPYLLGKAL